MFEITADARSQLKQYVVQCAACFGDGAAMPPQAVGSAAAVILAQKYGTVVTFAVDNKAVYTASVLLPEGSLYQSLDRLYQKAKVALREAKDRVTISSIKITAFPQQCKTVDAIDWDSQGVILFSRGRSHYLLPEEFLGQGLSRVGALEYLCRCLALPPGTWRDRTARIMTFDLIYL